MPAKHSHLLRTVDKLDIPAHFVASNTLSTSLFLSISFTYLSPTSTHLIHNAILGIKNEGLAEHVPYKTRLLPDPS